MAEADRGRSRGVPPSENLRSLGARIRSGESFSPDQACLVAGKVLYFSLMQIEQKRKTARLRPGSPEESASDFRISNLERRLLDASEGDYIGAQVEIESDAERTGEAGRSATSVRGFSEIVDDAAISNVFSSFASVIPQSGRPLLELLDPVEDAQMIEEILRRRRLGGRR